MAYRPEIKNGTVKGFDPYEAVQRVYDLKGDWDRANRNNDTQGKNTASRTAQEFYNQLRKNGYGSVADDLTKSNYGQAKVIRDYYAKTGRTATRPYLYGKGKKFGMSEADIDKLTTFDNDTGQIYFGGQLLGTPDTISSDGVSYWNDTKKLDSVFDDVATKQGWTVNSGVGNAAYNQAMKKVEDTNAKSVAVTDQSVALGMEFAKQALADYKKLGDERTAAFNYANQDITNTDEYKSTWNSIMPSYQYQSDKAALNAAADSTSTNGGNIDSFAAANARRQREASLAKGQQLAGEQARQAYLTRIAGMNDTANERRSDVGKGINANIGMANAAQGYANAYSTAAADERNTAQGYFDNWQDMLDRVSGRKVTDANANLITAQANQIDAETSNRIPVSVLRKSSPYFDKDGNVNTSIDYRKLINNTETLLNKELAKPENEQDKGLISGLREYLAMQEDARLAKTGLEEFRQYANDGYVYKYGGGIGGAVSRVYGPSQQVDKQMANATELAYANNNMEYLMNAENNASAERMNEANNASGERINNANIASTERISDAKLASDERTNNINSQITMYGLTTDADLKRKELELQSKQLSEASNDYGEYDMLLRQFDVSDTGPRNFIETFIKPAYEGKETITPEGLKMLILNNSEKYNIDVPDAKIICRAFGADVGWLDGYVDRSGDEWNKGMKKKQ